METRDDVEAFAALLRQLKDRTDRSYGSLARRVNMNTSTLHRYCAGEAVPQDFAPLERLAAFCRATPEERLELHRLWLLAVAARQRGRTGTAADEEPVAQAPASEEAVAQAPAAEDDTVPETVENPEPAAAPAPRPWYRRRRILASTAVACALLATLSSLSALSADRGSSDTAASPSGRPGTTAPAAPHRSSKPSASSSPSPGRTSPSPHSQDKGKGPGSTAPTKGTGTGTGQTTVGVPLTWSANSQIWEGGCGHNYVIDKPPTQVPPPPLPQDAGPWAATQGAVHGRQTMVQISVQGRSSTAVVLEALRVRIAGRTTPAPGNAYSTEQGCGGGLTPRYFDVNLDIDRPIAHSVAGNDNDNGGTVPAVQFPYRVSAQDPEVLLVTATTETYDCNWYLELDWSSQGRTGTIRIDDHGRPFRTSSIKGLPHYGYGTNGHGVRQWVPYGS
ncbi:helix-turn-helix transcriptional regulator [Streptomyces sp. TLI_185]|uniref:helix-turn-helix domain-containing protein n=1 Tax=Streptomyces sp. TLI_185 TaxID=2485151 RepID=UPI000F4EFEF9|nr:helix-turn-helix transcriptional regulator [Streptomyces sp. TLI_185]RPF37223.1 helix-turn-helix protein [Streptomyces sp. TLI_185]